MIGEQIKLHKQKSLCKKCNFIYSTVEFWPLMKKESETKKKQQIIQVTPDSIVTLIN